MSGSLPVRLCLIASYATFVLSACTRAVQPVAAPLDARLADPGPLAGHWRVELREQAAFERLPIIGESRPWFYAELDLRRAADIVGGVISHRDSLVGTLTHTDLYMGDSVAISLRASGRMESNGQVVVTVTYPGPCPCATLTLTGVMADGEVNGRSEHRRADRVGKSRFRMRR